MPRYIERPKVIYAIKYEGFSGLDEIKSFMEEDFERVLYRPFSEKLLIDDFTVSKGDYIVRDFKYGYIVMDKKNFESQYEQED